jgi:hypothetical protein
MSQGHQIVARMWLMRMSALSREQTSGVLKKIPDLLTTSLGERPYQTSISPAIHIAAMVQEERRA